MVRRFEIPGFSSSSKRTSVPESVTADRIFFADTLGSSSISMMPAGEEADFDIFDMGSWRSRILAVAFRMYGSGRRNVFL